MKPYVIFTIPALVGTSPTDQRIGKVIFSNGVSRPQYYQSSTGVNYETYLNSIGVVFTEEFVDLDSQGKVIA